MRVVYNLQNDIRRYGFCQYIETDTQNSYRIDRLHPWSSMIEAKYKMDEIERTL